MNAETTTANPPEKPELRGRFAPSPTGALHLGNVMSFLVAYLSIRSRKGKIVMRMEDLGDHHPAGCADAICRDLEKLGFDWDEGYGSGGPDGPYSQSERLDFYHAAIRELFERGLAYPCGCSRHGTHGGTYAPHSGEYRRYDGFCRGRFHSYAEAQQSIGPGRFPAWRFRVEPGIVRFTDFIQGPQSYDVAKTSGDFVLARHPDGAGYQLAVVVDDLAMHVTEVVRGLDLLECTPWQILLRRTLSLSAPEVTYGHLPLVTDAQGERLAKRLGSLTVGSLLAAGVRPERILGVLGCWGGWLPSGTECTMDELLERYDPSTLRNICPILDGRVLDWLQKPTAVSSSRR